MISSIPFKSFSSSYDSLVRLYDIMSIGNSFIRVYIKTKLM